MKYKIGDLIAAEYWEDDVDSKGLQIGFVYAIIGNWYKVYWNSGETSEFMKGQLDVYRGVLEARMVKR